MAYVNSSSAPHNLFADRISTFFDAFVARMRQQRLYRKTLNELDALTDRELADLGLNRSNLRTIARDASRNTLT